MKEAITFKEEAVFDEEGSVKKEHCCAETELPGQPYRLLSPSPQQNYEFTQISRPLDILFENCEQVIKKFTKDELLLTAVWAASFVPRAFFLLIERKARNSMEGIPHSKEELEAYWSTVVPKRRRKPKSYLKYGHVLRQQQMLYIQMQQGNTLEENVNLSVRTSGGQIIITGHDCEQSTIEKFLSAKLKSLPSSSTLCFFISKHLGMRHFVELLQEVAKKEVDFVYTGPMQRKYDTIQAGCFVPLQNSRIFAWKGGLGICFGSLNTMQRQKSGERLVDTLIQSHQTMLKNQEQIMSLIPIISFKKFDRSHELKQKIFNMIKIEQAEKQSTFNIRDAVEKCVTNLVIHCLDETVRLRESEESKLNPCHFPQIMKYSKQCKLCLDRFNNKLTSKKKKTKYECQACSVLQKKSVPLCVLCFSSYHNEINCGDDFGRQNAKRVCSKSMIEQLIAENEQRMNMLFAAMVNSVPNMSREL